MTTQTQLEHKLIGILMMEPSARGRLLQSYPRFGQVLSESPDPYLRPVYDYILSHPGRPVTPDIMAAHFGEVVPWPWQPLWDEVSLDDIADFPTIIQGVMRFYQMARLHQLAERAQGLDVVIDMAGEIGHWLDTVRRLHLETAHIPQHDPSIQSLLVQARERLATPDPLYLAPVGIPLIDETLGGGLKVTGGETVVIYGPEKQRKTTTARNMVRLLQKRYHLPTVWISTEEGFTPEELLWQFIAMEATALAYAQGKAFGFTPEICSQGFRYLERWQQDCVEEAMEGLGDWNMLIFGPGLDHGASRDLFLTMDKIRALAEGPFAAKVVVMDHAQQFRITAGSQVVTEHETMLAVVSESTTLVSEYHMLLILLSQIDRLHGRPKGGGGLEGAGNSLWFTVYDEQDPLHIGLECRYNRRGPRAKGKIALDPYSGLFFPHLKEDKDVIPI